MDIETLLQRPEGKTLEFKREIGSHDAFLRTVVAFANTAGGRIVVGVTDRARGVVGVADPFALEERLASLVADGVEPRVLPEIDIVPWRRTHLLVITVHPGPSRPYRLASLGADAGVFVRLGSTNRLADRPLVAELARSARNESFDETPMDDLTAAEVDLAQAREAFAGIRSVSARDLHSLRLLSRRGGRDAPTVAGVLLFGRDRERHFPDAWFQLARFKGRSRTHFVDSAEVHARPDLAADQVMAFVRRNTAMRVTIAGVRREESWEYPLPAVREAVLNALVHADYSQVGGPLRLAVFDDRLEVENPGILVPGLTIDGLRSGASRIRNRAVARVFRELGLIEQWGSGVRRMIELCEAAGLPEPEFEEIALRFRVTLRCERGEPAGLDALDLELMRVLVDEPGRSTAELAGSIGRSPRATRTRLRDLVELGFVVEIGSAPNDPRRRYYVAEERAPWGRRSSAAEE